MGDRKKTIAAFVMVGSACFALCGCTVSQDGQREQARQHIQQEAIRREEQAKAQAAKRQEEEGLAQRRLADEQAIQRKRAEEQKRHKEMLLQRNARIRAEKQNIDLADWQGMEKNGTAVKQDYNLSNMYVDEEGYVHTLMAMAQVGAPIMVVDFRIDLNRRCMQMLKAHYIYPNGRIADSTDISHEWGDPVVPGSPIDRYYGYIQANYGKLAKLEALPTTDDIASDVLLCADFTVGGFSIGDTKDKAASMFGDVKKGDLHGKVLYCEYSDIEIHYLDGKARTILTNGATARTPRGIREGSPVSDVWAAYGDNYEMFAYEGQNMYEYYGVAETGQPYILRFAVNPSNQRVDYIGCRPTQE